MWLPFRGTLKRRQRKLGDEHMTEAEFNTSLFHAYLLGQRLFSVAHNLSIPGTEVDKEYDLLRDVAGGGRTLVDSPTEKIMKFPKMRSEVKERLPDMTNRLIERDKQLAMRILEGMDANLA